MVHLEHFSDHPLDYITEFYTAEKVRIDSCPHCHSCRRLHLHGIYHRHVIWYEDVFSIPVQRHYCIH
ncbi:MAG TPA: transposase, partial [Acetobacterium sp.]|nr:transposase [Acetobacterium sp.]